MIQEENRKISLSSSNWISLVDISLQDVGIRPI